MIGSAGDVTVEKMYIEEATSQIKIVFKNFLMQTTLCMSSSVVVYDIVRFDHHVTKCVDLIEVNQCI